MFKALGIFLKHKGLPLILNLLTIKNTDLNLVLLRPYDLVYLGELVGRSRIFLSWLGKRWQTNLSLKLRNVIILKNSKNIKQF